MRPREGLLNLNSKTGFLPHSPQSFNKALSCWFSHYFKCGVCVHVMQKIDMWSVALSRSWPCKGCPHISSQWQPKFLKPDPRLTHPFRLCILGLRGPPSREAHLSLPIWVPAVSLAAFEAAAKYVLNFQWTLGSSAWSLEPLLSARALSALKFL